MSDIVEETKNEDTKPIPITWIEAANAAAKDQDSTQGLLARIAALGLVHQAAGEKILRESHAKDHSWLAKHYHNYVACFVAIGLAQGIDLEEINTLLEDGDPSWLAQWADELGIHWEAVERMEFTPEEEALYEIQDGAA